jgi:HK97 family phage major capsid protein
MLTTTTNDMKSITPDQIAQLITLPVQAASVAAQVASLLSTSSTRTQLPIIAADPSAAWVAEGAEIGASDPTVDDIVVTPSKIAGLTIITNELAADTSPAAAGIVGDGLARDIALKIDAAFFGSKGASLIQPAGLEDLAGVSLVDAGVAWANLDPFAEAIANAEGLGLMVDSFIANPADALLLAQLKESYGSNKQLLGSDQ